MRRDIQTAQGQKEDKKVISKRINKIAEVSGRKFDKLRQILTRIIAKGHGLGNAGLAFFYFLLDLVLR